MRIANEHGLTLLEAVVALAIVGVAGVATLGALGAELRGAAHAREAIETTSLAEQSLAVVELLPAASLTVLPDSVARGQFAAPLDHYSWHTEAHAVPGEPDVYGVTVTVSSEAGAIQVLNTRLYRPGPAGALP